MSGAVHGSRLRGAATPSVRPDSAGGKPLARLKQQRLTLGPAAYRQLSGSRGSAADERSRPADELEGKARQLSGQLTLPGELLRAAQPFLGSPCLTRAA